MDNDFYTTPKLIAGKYYKNHIKIPQWLNNKT